MITSMEADQKAILNGTEVENDDEHDLLIDKSDRSQTETMMAHENETKIRTSNSNIRSNYLPRLSNIKHLLPLKLYPYFKNSPKATSSQNIPHSSNHKQGNYFWRTIANSPSIRGSSRLYYGFSHQRANSLRSDSAANYYNDGYADDDLLRCIKAKGHRYSNGRRKWHILFLTLTAIILFLTSIYLLIKLRLLIEAHKSLSEYQQNGWQAAIFNKHQSNENLHIQIDQHNEAKSSRWLISSPKCHIPKIDPWHESIKSYVRRENDVNCHKISKQEGFPEYALSYVSDNKLYLNDQALSINVDDNSSTTDCCYRQILRSDENDEDLIYNETCNRIEISDSSQAITIPFELIKLECSRNNYTNYHSFIVHDLEEEEACKRVAEKKLDIDKYYNVLLVGMDTISRLNGYRQLNKTLDFLKKTFKTLEFYGYNKVGENTFPNLIPLLTGLKPTQLTETQCWLPTNYTDEGESGDDYLDNCKYLWNFYQELGYITYFGEDWSTFSTFNYLKPGFKRKPTLFYGRPFAKARKSLLLPLNPSGCSSCLLDKPIVEVDLTNLKNFVEEHKNSPHFAFQWMNCPQHDNLNGASQVDTIVRKFFEDIQSLVDERTFIFFFSDHGYRWNNFVSTRIGHYEASLPLFTIAPPKHFIKNHPDLFENLKQHQTSIVTPFDIFKTLIAIRNLGAKPQQQVLLQKLKRSSIGETNDSAGNNNFGTSEIPVGAAFTSNPTATTTVKQLQQVDGQSYKQDFQVLSLLDKHNSFELDRSCIEAGIPDNYCVCHEFSQVNTSSSDVIGATYYLVYVYLYNLTRERQDICKLLDLETINESQMFDLKRMKSLTNKAEQISRKKRSENDQNSELSSSTLKNIDSLSKTTRPPQRASPEEVIEEHHFLPDREYNIRFTTKPGYGLFQEVVRYYGSDIDVCETEVKKAKRLLFNNPLKNHQEKYDIVMKMNKVCKFSVHSDSISRLNLYKGQSDCVKNNIELKKICYCKNQ